MRDDSETYHCFALCTRRLDRELVRHSDYKVISGAIPGRAGIDDLDGHIKQHVRVGIRQNDGGARGSVQVKIRHIY